jgi:inhibitor of Bruton tyrosine kinase
LDDFLDTITDVLSVANELMLERLSQICQEVIGRFVNVRNVCGLLNAISPSSIHEFKDAALEYICLSLESMLQGHHLNELDEDLLQELDGVVRENQLACLPFAKSGRAEFLLHERNPELAATITRNRQARIDAVSLRAKYLGLDTFSPGSVVEDTASPLVASRSRRKSSGMLTSPKLKAKASAKDMIFSMDDEMDSALRSPEQSPSIRPMTKTRGQDPLASSLGEDRWYDSRGKVLPSPKLGPQTMTSGPSTPKSPPMPARTPPSASQPWSLTPLAAPKADMRDIMAQTATTRTSTLTQELASSRATSKDGISSFSLPAPKMSQKDRKKLQHSQTSNDPVPQATQRPQPTSAKTTPAWQSVGGQKPATLREIMSGPSQEASASKQPTPRTSSTPQLTMRQTVANANGKSASQAQKAVIGPSGQGIVQQRSVSDSKQAVASSPEQSCSWQVPQHSNSKPIPQSIRHQPIAEPVLGLSMSEIVAQQQLEKEVVKEAVAPRDLQDIQAEQEFEEWWNRESARVQEAERKTTSGTSKPKKHRHRGKGGKGKATKAEQNAAD